MGDNADVLELIQDVDRWNSETMTSMLSSKKKGGSAPSKAQQPDALLDLPSSIWDEFEEANCAQAACSAKRGNAGAAMPCTNRPSVIFCADCQQESRMEDAGFFVCTLCGDVGVSFVDDTPEWRYYGQDDSKGGDPSRCGISSNYLMPESSIGTVISTRYGESFKMRQARQYHSWNVMDYRGRNLYRIFDKLQTQSQKHGINYIIIEHAKQLYKTISTHQLFRGQNKEGLIADCVYRACKDKGVPRSIKEIAVIFGLEEHVMTKGNRCFTSVWNRIQNTNASQLPPQSNQSMLLSNPSDYIERFCSPLNISSAVLQDCLRVAKLVETSRLVPDNTAPSIAAAVLFYTVSAHKLPISKEDIAKASKKSEVTIGKCFKKLSQYDSHLRGCLGV